MKHIYLIFSEWCLVGVATNEGRAKELAYEWYVTTDACKYSVWVRRMKINTLTEGSEEVGMYRRLTRGEPSGWAPYLAPEDLGGLEYSDPQHRGWVPPPSPW
jgi:hypothetical protein